MPHTGYKKEKCTSRPRPNGTRTSTKATSWEEEEATSIHKMINKSVLLPLGYYYYQAGSPTHRLHTRAYSY